MAAPSDDLKHQPACVVRLIGQLGEVADAFEAGKPLGPYLVEALLEDVDLCPALQQTADGPEARSLLHEAVKKARASAQVAVVCPSVEREWPAKELRAAVARAQESLDDWRASILARSDASSKDALAGELKCMDFPRCRACAFAEPAVSAGPGPHG